MSCLLLFVILGHLALGCHGNEMTSHLLLLDSLPEDVGLKDNLPLVVRSNYSGSVRFQESDDFRMVINITSPSLPEAYTVRADVARHRDTLLLQVYQKSSPSWLSLEWLFIGIAIATFLVFLCTFIYAVSKLKSEKSMYDLAERKSYASSSQHGIYRSRNSMQMALQQGDIGLEEVDNIHNDDTLKRVPEMPDQEEAEAIEMRELKNKEKNEDGTDRNEDASVNISDKNLLKGRYQPKTIHKDLLKKGKRKRFRRAKVSSEPCDTVMEYPENSSEGSGQSDQECEEKEDEKTKNESREHHIMKGAQMTTFHPKLTRVVPPDHMREVQKACPPQILAIPGSDSKDGSKSEDPFLVQADIHNIGPASQILNQPPDRSSPTGAKSGVAPVPLPVKVPQRKVAFSDDDQRSDGKSCQQALDMFDEVSKRYDLCQRLDVIRESVTEDVSDCAEGMNRYSTSIYGSSEIFDTEIADRVYFDINDSDLEIPPIDMIDTDEQVSDGSVQNLSRVGNNPHSSNPGNHRNGSTNGRHGSASSKPVPAPKPNLKSPAFTSFGASQQPTNSNNSGDSEDHSPPLPPPPPYPLPQDPQPPAGDHDSGFDFPPPPPKLLKIPEQGLWKQQTGAKGDNYNYVDFQKNSEQKDIKEEIKKPVMKGRGKTYQGPRHLHLTLLSITCVLAMVGGVYSRMYKDKTTVHITVYAPRNFLDHKSTVYFNHETDGEVFYEKPMKVQRFDIANPIIKDLTSDFCVNHSCVQGCDENTGKCICQKGYKLGHAGKCQDINECMEGGAICDPTAGCLNSQGMYECICPGGFYGDGKTCKECRIPCNPGTYEIQPCTNTTQKICTDCLKVCPDGFFMSRTCKGNHNSKCTVCIKPCSVSQFESQTCQSNTSRVCKALSLLATPETSPNVILENLHDVQDKTITKSYLPSLLNGFFIFTLKRGPDLEVKGIVKSMQAAPLFVPINSSENGSFKAIPQSGTQSQVLRQFCPHPVPDHYILHNNKINNVTYSLDSEGKPVPCQSSEQVGYFPEFLTAGQSHFLYRQPGPMTDLFDGIKSEFFRTSSIWVEKSKRCQHYSKRCEDCTRECTRQMSQSNAECTVMGSESDNGYSPRLRICYTCCVRNNCSDVCKDYHKRHCQPKKCLRSNWMQFHILPQWDSSKTERFYCHIKPLPQQHLLELEYSLKYMGQSFYKGKVSVKGDNQWEDEGKMEVRDKILDLKIDSRMGPPPNFLEGEIMKTNGVTSGYFKVGRYRNQGPSVLSSVISGESVSIRPKLPFGQMDSIATGHKYDQAVLQTSVLATEAEGPYKVNSDLMVGTYLNDTYPYNITHKNAPPQLRVQLRKDISILESVFNKFPLVHKSIKAELTNNGTHWVVHVTGRLKHCPGLLKVELYDPGYPSKPLFKHWAAVRCPKKFGIKFGIPTTDVSTVEKEVVVMLYDNEQTHQIRIHNPGDYDRRQVDDQEETLNRAVPAAEIVSPIESGDHQEKMYGVVFTIPYLASVSGAIILLLCLAVFGLAVAPDSVGPDTPALKLHHTCMMIGYVTVNFLYSVVITMTVFTLIVLAVNKDSSEFVSEYRQQWQAKTAVHHLELAAMQRHLQGEITRQVDFASQTKSKCEKSMEPVIRNIDKLRQELLQQTTDLFEQRNIVALLSEHSHDVLTKLSQNMFSFRNNFNVFVRNLLSQLTHDIESSLEGVKENSWLAGARFLHGAVLNIRRHLNNVSTKQFLDWANFKHSLARMADELSTPPVLPDIPHIDGVPIPTAPPPGSRTARQAPAPDATVRKTKIYSHWFYPFGSDNKAGRHPSSQQFEDDRRLGGLSDNKGFMALFYVFLGLMLCIDFILFLHRFTNTISMGRLLLYGYPEYVDCRKRANEHDEEMDDDVFKDNTEEARERFSKTSFKLRIKKFFIQVVSTLFIPKAAITVVLCVIMFAVVRVSDRVFSPEMLKSLGLHYDMNTYLGLQREVVNARILAHAAQINGMEYPAYQSWMVAYIERHQRVLEVHKQQLAAMTGVHNQTYCQYLTYLGMDTNCSAAKEDGGGHSYRISTPGCRFAPVFPNFYVPSSRTSEDIAEDQLGEILGGMRQIVLNTCQIITVFMSVVVLKELFGAVLWIYIRRSGFVRLRIIFETTEEQTSREEE